MSLCAFFECISLTNITIGNAVATIDANAFGGCSRQFMFDKGQTIIICYPAGKIGSYTVPDGVSDIGYMAFSYSSLTTIFIPNSVSIIEDLRVRF